ALGNVDKYLTHDISLSSFWSPHSAASMTRLWIAGPCRGRGAAGEGDHPGFFRKGVFLQKIKDVKTQKSNKRKNFGDTPAAVFRPCPEPDGVRLHRFKASEA